MLLLAYMEFTLPKRSAEWNCLTKGQSEADKMKVIDNTSKVKLREECALLSLG